MKNLSILFLFFVSCLSLTGFGQKKSTVYKTVYQVNSPDLLFPVPDTVLRQLGIKEGGIKIPLANLFYTNYYRDGLSRTDIEAQISPGIRMRTSGATTGSFFSRSKDSAFFLYEEDRLIEKYRYQVPTLVKKGETKKIKDYNCEAYYYTDSDSSQTTVWFSKDLPFGVSPGVYYKKLGGVVQIDYRFKKSNSSIELISHENTNEKVDFKSNLAKPKGERKTHFLFQKPDR